MPDDPDDPLNYAAGFFGPGFTADWDCDHRDLFRAFHLLATDGTGGCTLAAAAVLLALLESIADGESALRGGPTDLPVLGRDVQMPPERYREVVRSQDRPHWDMLLFVTRRGFDGVSAEPGTDLDAAVAGTVRKLVNDVTRRGRDADGDPWEPHQQAAYLVKLLSLPRDYDRAFSEWMDGQGA